jgi:hypothetical protein
MAAQKKRWSELSPSQRAGIITLGAVEVVLTVAAVRDLRKRPAAQVRGPKPLWGLACSVQPFGPVAYLVLGRRR